MELFIEVRILRFAGAHSVQLRKSTPFSSKESFSRTVTVVFSDSSRYFASFSLFPGTVSWLPNGVIGNDQFRIRMFQL